MRFSVNIEMSQSLNLTIFAHFALSLPTNFNRLRQLPFVAVVNNLGSLCV
jgi:hypothetical protein